MENKILLGLLGAPRAGKDHICRFLEENYGFKSIAFADSIKEEFGISKEEFEKAKNTDKIEELRAALWQFSAEKKSQDPLYFINKTMEFAYNCKNSVIINDIRTVDELHALFVYQPSKLPFRRVYLVERNGIHTFDENDILVESKLSLSVIEEYSKHYSHDEHVAIKNIYNNGNIDDFDIYLNNFFKKEFL